MIMLVTHFKAIQFKIEMLRTFNRNNIMKVPIRKINRNRVDIRIIKKDKYSQQKIKQEQNNKKFRNNNI